MFHFRLKQTLHKRYSKRSIRSVLVLLSFTISLSWGTIMLTHAEELPQRVNMAQGGAVDWVSPQYQFGQQLYQENCASCHIAVPPQVLPTQTWQQLLQDTQHYGVELPELVDPPRLIIWNYLQRYSRPLLPQEEITPYRVNRSRYFRALHPNVDFPSPVTLTGCVSCHPGANQSNFRQLSSQWQ
ncbi:MAG: cytochrome C [Microcoleaceae cyanobacterium]